jgi:hypothetical protein
MTCIDRCEAAIGHQRAMCWSELDQLVTDRLSVDPALHVRIRLRSRRRGGGL